jgi:hypothetical protein
MFALQQDARASPMLREARMSNPGAALHQLWEAPALLPAFLVKVPYLQIVLLTKHGGQCGARVTDAKTLQSSLLLTEAGPFVEVR